MPGLIVDDLHVRFGDVHALTGMGFSLAPGELVGFLGPNGAGKTTTMRAILGLVRATSGQVRWNDRPIDHATRRQIGYMPEERGLYPRMKVLEQVTYFGRLAGLDTRAAKAAAERWLERLGLGERFTSHVQDLSHGNQQRVQLAVALVHDPQLLVLDEPFSGLDPLAVTTMSEIITERAEHGAAVLFSSHQLDLVEGLCDDVVIVDRGAPVATGRVGELRAASPRRVLRIELDEAVLPDDPSWPPQLDGARVRSSDPTSFEAEIDRDVDLAGIVQVIGSGHRLRSFSFEPPPLSQIFAEAVS